MLKTDLQEPDLEQTVQAEIRQHLAIMKPIMGWQVVVCRGLAVGMIILGSGFIGWILTTYFQRSILNRQVTQGETALGILLIFVITYGYALALFYYGSWAGMVRRIEHQIVRTYQAGQASFALTVDGDVGQAQVKQRTYYFKTDQVRYFDTKAFQNAQLIAIPVAHRASGPVRNLLFGYVPVATAAAIQRERKVSEK